MPVNQPSQQDIEQQKMKADNANILDMKKFKKEYSDSRADLLDDLAIEADEAVKKDDSDDLEIPAFIRRKMM